MPAPSSTPTDALRAEGAVRSLGGVRAVDGVSFAAAAGSLVAIVGANGSGKSTLLRLLGGILAPDAGRVEVLGADPVRQAHTLRPRLGYAEQHPALDPELTGRETLRLFHALRGLPRGGRNACIAAAAERFGLAPFLDRRVEACSGGERQRLHLAAAILHDPELLLLDEPTAGIDAEGRRAFWGRMADRRAAGGTAVVSTHDLAEVERHADRVLLLHRGRLAADGAPAALVREHGRHRATLTLAEPPADPSALAALLAPAADEVEVDGRTATLWRRERAAGRDPALDLLDAQGIDYLRYEREEADLASACVRLTGAPVEAAGAAAEAVRGGGRRGGRRR